MRSHTKQNKKRNLYNIFWMRITHPLKRNIFTGLWHRTLPTLHSMSAQADATTSSIHPSSHRNPSQLSPPLQWKFKKKTNRDETPTDGAPQTLELCASPWSDPTDPPTHLFRVPACWTCYSSQHAVVKSQQTHESKIIKPCLCSLQSIVFFEDRGPASLITLKSLFDLNSSSVRSPFICLITLFFQWERKS